MEHPCVCGEPAPADATSLHRRRPGLPVSRRRDPARRPLYRLRLPLAAKQREPPPRGRSRCVPLLDTVPCAALRRDHGGQHIAPLVAVALCALAALLYVLGVRRMRRPWPVWRTALFLAGLAALLAALGQPIDMLATQLFSVHMVQHMLLTVAAAPLLLLGAPIRPLLRGLPRIVRTGVIRPLARARPIRSLLHALRHPLIAGALYVGGLYAWHLPALYDAALADDRIHVAEHAWFFVSALLFWSVVIDPAPFRGTLGYAARLPYLLVAGA